jgi:hypothetical protein
LLRWEIGVNFKQSTIGGAQSAKCAVFEATSVGGIVKLFKVDPNLIILSTTMNTHSSLVKECIALARRALDGEVTLDQYRTAWPVEADKLKSLWNVMHMVENFLVDADIREKDPAYAKELKNSAQE